MGVGAFDGDGGEAGVEHEPVGGGAFELFGGLRVGAAVCQREPVPEFSQFRLFGLGEYAVGHGVGHALLPALLEGLVDGGAVPVGAVATSGQVSWM